MSLVSIVIPTFRRPKELERLLFSIYDDIKDRDDVHIIVADNDRFETARAIVDEFRVRSSLTINYQSEPEPGVSNARNAAMRVVETRFILFLDDDMEILVPYLDSLLSAARSLGTAITFAPAIAMLPENRRHLDPWLKPLYSRDLGGPTRIVSKTLGTGGSLIDLASVRLQNPPFDPALNEVGGEDDAFFDHIISQGGSVGWCAEAKAWEHVPAHRTSRVFLWRRQFAFGQSPTREAADQGLKGLPAILKWSAVGVVQTIFHAGMYLLTTVFRRPSRVHHFGRLAQGVGKVFWWDRLSPRLYGRNAR